jgi:hypothetical protein
VVIGGYPWTDLAPEAVALAFGAYAAADGDFRDAVLTAVNMGRDADTTAAVAGALAGATQGISAIPAHWAAAIGPARGRCLPSMAGHHVLDVAELLVPEEGGKWGEGLVMPDFLPVAVRDAEPVAVRDAELQGAHEGPAAIEAGAAVEVVGAGSLRQAAVPIAVPEAAGTATEAPGLEPAESGGTWTQGPESEERSPLVGAGNSGQQDSEGRL